MPNGKLKTFAVKPENEMPLAEAGKDGKSAIRGLSDIELARVTAAIGPSVVC